MHRNRTNDIINVQLNIDDVVGAIPVHLFAGIWGTLAVVLTNSDASLGTQIYSILVVGPNHED